MKINFKKILITASIICFAVFFFTLIITSRIIGEDVKKWCLVAQDKYQDNCTAALSAYLEDERNDYKSRNSAIWALGQLGDKSALPVLEEYYTGKIPDKESLNKGISQYELKKAINLCKGGFNITHFFRKI